MDWKKLSYQERIKRLERPSDKIEDFDDWISRIFGDPSLSGSHESCRSHNLDCCDFHFCLTN